MIHNHFLILIFSAFIGSKAYTQSSNKNTSSPNRTEYAHNVDSLTPCLNSIPKAFFKQTGISKLDITTKEKNFSRGCVKRLGQKFILLNYVKTNKNNNTQVISLSFGGKRFYTKEYHLSYRKGKLKIKEKEL